MPSRSKESILKDITLLVVVFNEEREIESLLRWGRRFGETVVVDSYSTDQTVAVVQKYTDKIFFHKFTGNFSLLRNFAMIKATTDWVLVLDTDERLGEGSEDILRELIKDKKIDGYWFPRKNYINEKTYLKHGYFYPDWQLRLFRNHQGYKYSGVIHEQIQIPKEKTRFVKDIEIYHSSVRTKYDSIFHFHRLLNYIKIEGKDLAQKRISNVRLLKETFVEVLRHFWRSFVKLQGYKDGYNGFRAAVIYGVYQGSIKGYALKIRLFGD